jgi:hypothetical protein
MHSAKVKIKCYIVPFFSVMNALWTNEKKQFKAGTVRGNSLNKDSFLHRLKTISICRQPQSCHQTEHNNVTGAAQST